MDKPIKRTQYLKIRLTALEKKMIEKKAEHAGMQTAPYCRTVALGQRVDSKLTSEELAVYEMLVKYYNNFQSIKNLLQNKDSKLAQEITSTAQEIKKHLQQMQ